MKTNSELRGLWLTRERQKARRQRNRAIAIAIGCVVLLFYAVTTGHCERRGLKIAR